MIETIKNLMPHIRLDGDNIPLWRLISYKRRERILHHLANAITLFSVIILMFPIYWMFSTALRPRDYVYQVPTQIIPPGLTLDIMISIFRDSLFGYWYVNSIIVSLGVVILNTTAATLAGYGLARLNFPRKKTFARLILFGYMFPAILLAIPMFIFWRELGWIDSYIGLILALTAICLPFSIWLMWKFFQTVPESLEESARMSGASRFRAFYEISLPLAKPGMIAVAVFAYAISWDNFTIPFILMVDNEKWVLTIGLFSFTQGHHVFWEQIMAASALVIVPSFIFVFFLQKYLLRGFRAGGVG